MEEKDETTAPGGPVLLEGPEEAKALANLATMLRFYAAQIDQMAGEARRGPLAPRRRSAMWNRLRGLANDFSKTANALAPWNAPRPATKP
jgi:hypothetical protein